MFRELLTSNFEVFGFSSCCHEPVYMDAPDGIGMCSHCGEWSDLTFINEEEESKFAKDTMKTIDDITIVSHGKEEE